MKKTIIRLTESDLHRIVYDSVYHILEQRQDINEGWKNWAMAGALGAATMFGNPQAANAQNPVVDGLRNPKEVVGTKYQELALDPNKPIKYNYDIIKRLISLHLDKKYADYHICPYGIYKTEDGKTFRHSLNMIHIKGKGNEEFRTVSGQIIEALTKLYTTASVPFKVPSSDCWNGLNIDPGRSGKYKIYFLPDHSPLYRKVYQEVLKETGLKDGGTLRFR